LGTIINKYNSQKGHSHIEELMAFKRRPIPGTGPAACRRPYPPSLRRPTRSCQPRVGGMESRLRRRSGSASGMGGRDWPRAYSLPGSVFPCPQGDRTRSEGFPRRPGPGEGGKLASPWHQHNGHPELLTGDRRAAPSGGCLHPPLETHNPSMGRCPSGEHQLAANEVDCQLARHGLDLE
jgi:hypothetical protein